MLLRKVPHLPFRFDGWALRPSNSSLSVVFAHSASLVALSSPDNLSVLLLCTSGPCHTRCDVCASTRPSLTLAASAEVLRFLHAKRIVLIVDATETASSQDVFFFLEKSGVAVVVFKADLSSNTTFADFQRHLVSLLDNTFSVNDFLLLFPDETKLFKVLQLAQKLGPAHGLFNQRFHWTILSPVKDIERLVKMLPPSANVILFRNPHTLTVNNTMNLKAVTCNDCSNCKQRVLKSLIEGEEEEIELFASFTRYHRNGHETRLKRVATYSSNRGLVRYDRIFPNTFLNFGGMVAKIGNTPFKVFSMRRSSAKIQIGNFSCHDLEGSLVDMVNFLAAKLNFRPCFVMPNDMVTGNFNPVTGSGTGLIGMAVRREVILVAHTVLITHTRSQGVDYTAPFMNEPTSILIRRQVKSPSVFEIVLPLDPPAWAAVTGALVLTGIFEALISRFSPVSAYNLRLKTAVLDEISFKSNILKKLEFFVGQGQSLTPFSYSARCISFAVMFFSVVIINTYTAVLISYLTIPNNNLQIRNIEDLSQQSTIHPFFRKGSYLNETLRDTSDPVLKKIRGMLWHSSPKTYAEGVQMVLDSNLAYMSLRSKLMIEESKNCSALALLPESFLEGNLLAFVMPKNAHYSHRVNEVMKQMNEKGFVAQAMRTWFRRSVGKLCDPVVMRNTSNTHKAFEMNQLLAPWIIFVFLICVASVIWISEVLIDRKRRCWSFSWNPETVNEV